MLGLLAKDHGTWILKNLANETKHLTDQSFFHFRTCTNAGSDHGTAISDNDDNDDDNMPVPRTDVMYAAADMMIRAIFESAGGYAFARDHGIAEVATVLYEEIQAEHLSRSLQTLFEERANEFLRLLDDDQQQHISKSRLQEKNQEILR